MERRKNKSAGKESPKEAPPPPPVAQKAHGYEFGGPYVYIAAIYVIVLLLTAVQFRGIHPHNRSTDPHLLLRILLQRYFRVPGALPPVPFRDIH